VGEAVSVLQSPEVQVQVVNAYPDPAVAVTFIAVPRV
jgi:hypothetical protein